MGQNQVDPKVVEALAKASVNTWDSPFEMIEIPTSMIHLNPFVTQFLTLSRCFQMPNAKKNM